MAERNLHSIEYYEEILTSLSKFKDPDCRKPLPRYLIDITLLEVFVEIHHDLDNIADILSVIYRDGAGNRR